ncbi:MAG: hypothetical protein ACI4XR_04725 [Bacilli bacterium]
MEKQRKINTFVICGLIVIVVAMSIGYAALSQRLDITGTATVKSSASSWNIYFSDVANDKSGTGSWTTPPAISTDAGNSGTSNKITFSCELSAPGDSCSVTATIKNGGTTTAKYSGYKLTVDSTEITETTKTLTSGAIVTITPESTWTAGTSTLAQNDTGTFVIKMELPSTLTTLPTTDTEHSVTLNVNFVQNT